MSAGAMLVPASPWVTFGAGVGLLVLMGGFLSAGPVAALRAEGRGKLPERPRVRPYSWRELGSFLGASDESPGHPALWRLYRSQLRWDAVFVLLYAIALWFLIDGTLGRSLDPTGSVWRLAPVFAVLAAAFDLAEDGALLGALGREPRDDAARPSLLAVASLATPLKWLAAAACVAAVAVGTVRLALSGPGG